MVCDRALHRLANPPGGVGRELEAAAPVELLDRAVQPERSFLDQVEEGNAETAVALRDRHDQAQVRLDHAPLRARVAALDRLREHDLVRGGEQLVLADVCEEELQAVGRAARGRSRLGGGELRLLLLFLLGLRGGRGGGRRDLEPDPLELGGQLLDVLVVQVELDGKRLELGRFEVAALLRSLDHGARLVRLEQLVQLVLRQGPLSPFGPASRPSQSLTDSRSQILRLPGGTSVAPPGIPANRNGGFGRAQANPDRHSLRRAAAGESWNLKTRVYGTWPSSSWSPARGHAGRPGARSPGRA